MRARTHSCIAVVSAAFILACAAGAARAQSIGPVFVIAMENHNWTQPAGQSSPQQIYQNVAAPYINSLVTQGNPNAQYVSYCSNYLNSGVGIHPSEPNYIWNEAGTNLGVLNDNDPFGSGGTEQSTTQHLTGLMQQNGLSWKSYQEGTDLTRDGSNQLTNNVLPASQWTVPITSFSGTSTGYTNMYNGSHQYNYAAKHNPQVFFTDTSGGNNGTPSNPQSSHYAPMEQLSNDLAGNTVARYNWITPDQYNDQHTSLSGGFTYNGTHYTGDAANIAQGDNFLAMVVPQIIASDAFQNQNGTIIIWNDETEGGDDAAHTMMEIVISKLAKGNAYSSTIQYTHSSDLKTMQELYSVGGTSATGFLADAANATDLADLFVAGALPNAGATSIPGPAPLALAALGALGLCSRRRRS